MHCCQTYLQLGIGKCLLGKWKCGGNLTGYHQVACETCNISSTSATKIQNHIPITLFRIFILYHVLSIDQFPKRRTIGWGRQIPSTGKLEDAINWFNNTSIYAEWTDKIFAIESNIVKKPVTEWQRAIDSADNGNKSLSTILYRPHFTKITCTRRGGSPGGKCGIILSLRSKLLVLLGLFLCNPTG